MFWVLVLSLLVVIYAYLKYNVYNFWKKYGVPHEQPSVPLGNIKISHFLGKISLGNMFRENYEKFKMHAFHGFYAFYQPVLIVNDPALIKTILIREFSRFPDHGFYSNEQLDFASGGLFLLTGEKWKHLRAKLSPIFTTSRMKEMYDLLIEVNTEMINICESELQKSNVIEIKDVLARYTTDVITSVVYGFNCNSLKEPNNEFRYYGMKAFTIGKLQWLLGIFLSDLLEKFSLSLFPADLKNFVLMIVRDEINNRREKKVVRKDLLNLMMQLMDHGELEDEPKNESRTEKGTLNRLTLEDTAAQAFQFFVAGFETSSSTATYCLFELSMNPDIQEKLRAEIDRIADSTGFTYESIKNVEYLDMVINETIRKHPPLPFLNRICVEDFKIPNSDYTIPKGMRILISTSGIHHDPEIYQDPETFDPTRFSKENFDSKNNSVFLGFGDGPRYCIGKRFGMMQTKLAVASMLRHYRFHVCEKTLIPLKYNMDSFVQIPANGVHLRLERRDLSNFK